jgi:hypothetical protein
LTVRSDVNRRRPPAISVSFRRRRASSGNCCWGISVTIPPLCTTYSGTYDSSPWSALHVCCDRLASSDKAVTSSSIHSGIDTCLVDSAMPRTRRTTVHAMALCSRCGGQNDAFSGVGQIHLDAGDRSVTLQETTRPLDGDPVAQSVGHLGHQNPEEGLHVRRVGPDGGGHHVEAGKGIGLRLEGPSARRSFDVFTPKGPPSVAPEVWASAMSLRTFECTEQDPLDRRPDRQAPMDLYEALYTCRAMRRVRPDPVPLEVQARILDAAIRAPTGGNAQTWHFLLVDDPAVKGQLGPLYRDSMDQLWKTVYAPRIAAAAADPDHPDSKSSSKVSGARPNTWPITSRASHFSCSGSPSTTRRVGRSSPPSGAHNWLPGPRGSAVLSPWCWASSTAPRPTRSSASRSDQGWVMACCVSFGYPEGRWGIAPRRAVHEVSSRNRWGSPVGFDIPLSVYGPTLTTRPGGVVTGGISTVGPSLSSP